MHAYLLVGNNKESLDKKALSIAKKEKASLMEFELKKISDVRDLSRFTNLKVDGRTAILVKDIDEATREALNAFLKNLEEPQEDLLYILTAKSKHSLLPTIISRCQVIKVEGKVEDTTEEVKEFLNLDKAEKLIYIKKLKKRDKALGFLDNLIYESHKMINKEENGRLGSAKLAEAAEEAKSRINAYANPTLQLTNFVLQVV